MAVVLEGNFSQWGNFPGTIFRWRGERELTWGSIPETICAIMCVVVRDAKGSTGREIVVVIVVYWPRLSVLSATVI